VRFDAHGPLGGDAADEPLAKSGPEYSIAVNVSVDDLSALDFPDVAAELARAAGVEPSLITLEVTEGQMMRHSAPPRCHSVAYASSDSSWRSMISAQGIHPWRNCRDLPFRRAQDRSRLRHGFVRYTLASEASLWRASALRGAKGVETCERRGCTARAGLRRCSGSFIARPIQRLRYPRGELKWSARYPKRV